MYERVGSFKPDYKIAMDYDMMCRLGNEPYQYMPCTITIFDDTGISSTQYLRSLAESKKVYESYFGPSLKLECWQLRLKLLHYLLQSGFGQWLFRLKKKWGWRIGEGLWFYCGYEPRAVSNLVLKQYSKLAA